MKKYYCDICGKELSEREVIQVAPLGMTFVNYLKISSETTELGIGIDACAECLPEFYEVFKRTLLEVKRNATT